MTNFSIYIDSDLNDALTKRAAQLKVSKNSLIRTAIREMVTEDAPRSMREGHEAFEHEEDFERFADCKTLKEAFEKAGKKI